MSAHLKNIILNGNESVAYVVSSSSGTYTIKANLQLTGTFTATYACDITMKYSSSGYSYSGSITVNSKTFKVNSSGTIG